MNIKSLFYAFILSLITISAFAAKYESGKLKAPNYYDIYCSNSKHITCQGYVINTYGVPFFDWYCSTGDKYYDVSSSVCHTVHRPLPIDQPVIQFNSLADAEKTIGDKECSQI